MRGTQGEYPTATRFREYKENVESILRKVDEKRRGMAQRLGEMFAPSEDLPPGFRLLGPTENAATDMVLGNPRGLFETDYGSPPFFSDLMRAGGAAGRGMVGGYVGGTVSYTHLTLPTMRTV